MTDYITSANFKTRFGITTTSDDARIAAHITAASLEVDSMCGRQFGTHSGDATARYFGVPPLSRYAANSSGSSLDRIAAAVRATSYSTRTNSTATLSPSIVTSA